MNQPQKCGQLKIYMGIPVNFQNSDAYIEIHGDASRISMPWQAVPDDSFDHVAEPQQMIQEPDAEIEDYEDILKQPTMLQLLIVEKSKHLGFYASCDGITIVSEGLAKNDSHFFDSEISEICLFQLDLE